MGNTFEKSPTSPYDKSLLTQMRQRTLTDLLDCYSLLNQDYPECQALDFSQFEDVFGPMVEDPEPFFLELQNEHDIDGTIDIYETLATFAVFVKEKFEKKVSFIFQLFDFDRSNSLEPSELTITLQSVIRGLCKIVHLPPPHIKSLEIQVKLVFEMMDSDHNRKITFDEFIFWIKHNPELQEFILRYAGIQTFDNMNQRFEAIYSLCVHYFIKSSVGGQNEFANESTLKELIKCDKKLNLSESDLEFLFSVLHTTSASFVEGRGENDKTRIARRAYEHVMKAWCAYSASDIDGNNLISVNELHALIWIYEAEEPEEKRIVEEMRVIDKDGNGEIDRYEWIRHLCLTDKSGKIVFRNNLKRLFEMHDKDNSGYLSLDELQELVQDAFKDYRKKILEPEKKRTFEEMINTLSKEIMLELDANKSTNVDWEEFKGYMDVSLNKIQKLREFIGTNLAAF